MKVDIITLHAAMNYGAVLQAFATQEFFRQNGCEARIINAVFPSLKPLKRLIRLCSKGNKFMFPFKFFPVSLALLKSFVSMEYFRKKYLVMSDDKQYTTPEDFAKYESDADAFCTGSDQVWYPNFFRNMKSILYLSFVPKGSYKFSFAASFGVSELSPEEVSKVQEYINDYKYISVREDSGLKILSEQFHYNNAVCILDPTLCLDGDTWRKYAKHTTGGGGGRNTYILVYCIAYDKDLDDYAEALAKKTGLKILRLCSTWAQFSKNIFRNEKKILLPGILKFISLFDNARYIITNSFHGTAFSLNLNKDLICFYNGPKATRLENILSLTHTLHRHAESYEDFDVINRPVNWDEVNSILDGERRKASDWLKMVFADIQRHKH